MLSSMLGKSKSKAPSDGGASSTLSASSGTSQSRSATPTPRNTTGGTDDDDDTSTFIRTGTLTIRVVQAQGLTLPPRSQIPQPVQGALQSREGELASFVSPSSVSKQRLATGGGHHKRASVQRRTAWFMPYCVLEYDVNQVLVDALGGSDLFNPVYMHQAQFDVSRNSQVTVSVYLRSGERTKDKQHDMGDDLFLGSAKFLPELNTMGSQDEWHDIRGGDGQIKIGWSFKPESNDSLKIDDFELLKVIGKGSFGKVMQVRKKDTNRIYALKTLRKAHIASRNEITHTLAERFVLAKVNNPFIVPLKFSFQSEAKLYLVLSFVNGGELFFHLQQEQRFSEERSRFYCAELLLALEHLHEFNVVYRDLKPENILLDWTGHLALCDFGLCKLDMTADKTTSTFCGTPEYLSPEIILGQAYTKNIDWWTLGILLYEMMGGLPPFYDENTDKMYEKIVKNPLVFSDVFGSEAKSILKGLLTREPSQRLGTKGADEIKKHPFFSRHLDFKKLLAKQIQPPFKPNVGSPIDTANFDVVFTSELPYDSVVDSSNLSETVQARFNGFSYDGSKLSPI